jgi:catechol 2,3-dioxygenase-like lactoylglutathione lyase family enzyme
MTPPACYPRPINHIGLSVEDLDAAADWYCRVLGFEVIIGPFEITADDSYAGREVADFFGAELRKLRIVHLATGNGVGLEIFQFVDPPSRRPARDFEYTRTGFYHICVTDPDIGGLVRRIVESGGKQLSSIWNALEGQPYRAVYCQDPFGNVVEVLSHSYERYVSNQM